MMDRFALSERLKKSKPVDKASYIQDLCRDKVVLDMGCIRHNAEFALKDPNWLHQKIRSVAKKVVGVDYLPEEIEKLKKYNYEIVFGDVTKPIDIQEQFDVIVAGDLIEHLTNFEGFFDNCTKLLKPDGLLVITTPNPFFVDEFHFVAFKGHFLINPEHTCWIDPQALLQLSQRFGYSISEAYYIKNSWQLKNLICETKNNEYDILNGRWSQNSFNSKVIRRIAGILFNIFYVPYKILTGTNASLTKHCDYIAVLKK
jgi:2-polyprenyl-3-methyl-5-hydroxy-6-metoxy-1,4-benzoquinol methylase